MTSVTQLTSFPPRNSPIHTPSDPRLDTASTPTRTPKDLPRHPHSYSNHEFQSSPFLSDGEPIYDSPSPSSSISSFTTATLPPTSPPHPRRMPTSSSSSGEQGSRTLPSSSKQEGIIPSSSTSFSTKPLSDRPITTHARTVLESRYEGGQEEGKKAFGPKAGREFLARRQLEQQALFARDSFDAGDGGEEEKDESGFSIRERNPIRPTGSVPRHFATTTGTTTDFKGGAVGTNGKPSTNTSGSPTSSRRKPVPPLSIDSSFENHHDQTRDEPLELNHSHGHLRQAQGLIEPETPAPREPNRAFLPPPAAARQEQQQDFQLRRDPILNASPSLPPRPAHGTHKPPPISGLNLHSSQDPTHSFSGGQSQPLLNRNRKGSSGSTGSVSKDSVLRELGEAIGRERRRRERFEGEVEKAKVEMKEIEGNLIVMREKFSTLTEQQELTIRNLEQEIEEVEQELATADDLDETAAQEYLSLLSQQSLSHLARSAPSAPIDAFDPSLLRSSTGPTRNPHGASLTRSPSILAALRLKKRFSSNKLKRRTIDPQVASPDPPRDIQSSTVQNGGRIHNFTRENLSTSRATRQTETAPKKPDRNKKQSTGPAPRSSRSSPPPPRPIFRSDDTSPDSHPNNPTTSPRPKPPHRSHPPISGTTRNILTTQTESGIESDIVPSHSQEREKGKGSDEGFKGRLRKRSNSFKEGFNGTIRVLLHSNAPKGSNANGTSLNHSVNHWLRAA